MNDMGLIRAIEEMSITAWPSLRHILMDGWILGFGDGYTSRSNSVQPIYPGDDDVTGKIRHCEELYASAGLPPAFKISPVVQPAGLDSILESLGYRQHSQTSVQVLDTLPTANADDADIVSVPLGEWLDVFPTVSEISAERLLSHAAIVGKIPVPMCTMVARRDGQPVACARGVIQGDYVGIYDVHTIQSARRMGLASKVIRAILSWASGCGAVRAYLQVAEDNPGAIRLYGKLGFEHMYSYWYRVPDTGSKDGR